MEGTGCVSGQHSPVIQMKGKNECKYVQETFDYLKNRLSTIDCVLAGVKMGDIKLFISVLESLLHKENFKFNISEGNIKCKNIRNIYGYGKDDCKFSVTYYTIEFDWSS